MSYRDRKQRDHKNPKTHGDGRLTEILRCASFLEVFLDWQYLLVLDGYITMLMVGSLVEFRRIFILMMDHRV
ncbi:hypothetical protein SUGI_0694130 [Cryptomeria japonica]|nr:hypothetical protein SUGI_0694130 [Cryptomeria japonica]